MIHEVDAFACFLLCHSHVSRHLVFGRVSGEWVYVKLVLRVICSGSSMLQAEFVCVFCFVFYLVFIQF